MLFWFFDLKQQQCQGPRAENRYSGAEQVCRGPVMATLLQSGAAFLLQSGAQDLLQSRAIVFQSGAVITRWGNYCKMGQLLQNGA